MFGVIVTLFSCKADVRPKINKSDVVFYEKTEEIEEGKPRKLKLKEIDFSNRPAQEIDRKGSYIVDDLIRMLRLNVNIVSPDLRLKYHDWTRFNFQPDNFKAIYNHPSGKRTVFVYDDYRLAFYEESSTQLKNWNYLDELVKNNVRLLKYENGTFRSVYLYDDHVIVLRKFGRGVKTSVINSDWLKENRNTIQSDPNYSSMRNERRISANFRIEYPLEFGLD